MNTSPAPRAGRRKDGASTGSRPSLCTTYAVSHEANANTGLTTEAGERMTVCEKRSARAWYGNGNVRSMSAIFAAGRPSKENAQASPTMRTYAAAAGSRVRQTTADSHSVGMARAWHGLLHAAGSTASRVWQLSKYVVHSHVSVRHLSTRPQPSVV